MRNLRKWKPEVHVLVPYTVNQGAMVSPDYDNKDFRADVSEWFEALGLKWFWQPVTLENSNQVVSELAARSKDTACVAFNLCDGNEICGYPGVSVIRLLERARLVFTGGDALFYKISTSKLAMKDKFMKAEVPTAPYARISDPARDILSLGDSIGYPLIIKPDISAGSYGIGLKSIIGDEASARAQVDRVLNGEHRDYFKENGIFAERFILGQEFTALIVANSNFPGGLHVYPVVERVFHSKLPPAERFLSYDRYWEIYNEESPLTPDEPFCRYGLAGEAIQGRLSEMALRAFRAVGGRGYARVDMRMDAETRQVYVLEVNSNCGLSSDASSSIGQILRICELPFHTLVEEILRDAFDRTRKAGKRQRELAI